MHELLGTASRDLIAALVTMGVAIAIAFAVDRLVIARGGRVASKVARTALSRAAQTRLRLVRRLIFVIILAIGAALALSKFTQFSRLATGILASSAVLGLVIGFAARQTLANMVAGILLAITQPIRVGDTVTVADEHRARRRPHALLHLHRHRRRPPDGRAQRAGRRPRSSTIRPAIARRPRPSPSGCRRPRRSTRRGAS